jgi:hypothetical protein
MVIKGLLNVLLIEFGGEAVDFHDLITALLIADWASVLDTGGSQDFLRTSVAKAEAVAVSMVLIVNVWEAGVERIIVLLKLRGELEVRDVAEVGGPPIVRMQSSGEFFDDRPFLIVLLWYGIDLFENILIVITAFVLVLVVITLFLFIITISLLVVVFICCRLFLRDLNRSLLLIFEGGLRVCLVLVIISWLLIVVVTFFLRVIIFGLFIIRRSLIVV